MRRVRDAGRASSGRSRVGRKDPSGRFSLRFGVDRRKPNQPSVPNSNNGIHSSAIMVFAALALQDLVARAVVAAVAAVVVGCGSAGSGCAACVGGEDDEDDEDLRAKREKREWRVRCAARSCARGNKEQGRVRALVCKRRLTMRMWRVAMRIMPVRVVAVRVVVVRLMHMRRCRCGLWLCGAWLCGACRCGLWRGRGCGAHAREAHGYASHACGICAHAGGESTSRIHLGRRVSRTHARYVAVIGIMKVMAGRGGGRPNGRAAADPDASQAAAPHQTCHLSDSGRQTRSSSPQRQPPSPERASAARIDLQWPRPLRVACSRGVDVRAHYLVAKTSEPPFAASPRCTHAVQSRGVARVNGCDDSGGVRHGAASINPFRSADVVAPTERARA